MIFVLALMLLLLTGSTDSSYPSNEYCNFTAGNNTVTFNGKTRQQAYAREREDTNCSVCIKVGCMWCSAANQNSYCYNGQSPQYCNGQGDSPTDDPSTCDDEVSLIVFWITIFIGIVLPLLLMLSCFGCIVHLANRYLKSRRLEASVIPIEVDSINTVVELQPYHDVNVYTYVEDSSQHAHGHLSNQHSVEDSRNTRIVQVTATPIYS